MKTYIKIINNYINEIYNMIILCREVGKNYYASSMEEIASSIPKDVCSHDMMGSSKVL